MLSSVLDVVNYQLLTAIFPSHVNFCNFDIFAVHNLGESLVSQMWLFVIMETQARIALGWESPHECNEYGLSEKGKIYSTLIFEIPLAHHRIQYSFRNVSLTSFKITL
ncbi:unnamed protein product [Schistosoma rodhaini]|uniref:Uncharacterized protein n=1 Tax=Schistosoma rodhaini TaxID=6188 RepID=A0AA85F2C3_9TREM|nr:unnamed protein product [Schistosoma rodhaini]